MAIPNGLNPNIESINFRNGTAIITGGVTSGSVAIAADVGTPGNGSLYISTSGGGELWIVQSQVWTKLTIN
jgi:hypothetical protein